MDIIRDPAWQFVGVIIAVVALYLTVAIYVRQKDRKEILYEIMSSTSISSFKITNKMKMSIIFSGKHLSDASLVYIKLWNNGNKEIEPTDYTDPIVFNFGTSTKILEAIVWKAEPKDLEGKVELETNVHKLTIKPILLNKKDAIFLKILFDKFQGVESVSARVKGVQEIRNLSDTNLSGEGYIKSIGWGLKEFFFSSIAVRLSIVGTALGIIIAIITEKYLSLQESSHIVANIQVLLAPLSIGVMLYMGANISLSRRKVRYNPLILLAICSVIPILLLVYFIMNVPLQW